MFAKSGYRLFTLIIVLLLAALFASGMAHAAKEQWHRVKPHVNVGSAATVSFAIDIVIDDAGTHGAIVPLYNNAGIEFKQSRIGILSGKHRANCL